MIDLNVDEHGIAVLTVDMPGRPVNVLDWPVIEALANTFDRAVSDKAVKGIVICSGKTSFIAGADLGIMKDFAPGRATLEQARQGIGRIGSFFREIEKCGKPVVAAASGTALGGGLELMLACHYRIAAENPQAQFGFPEVKLGLLPGAGGTQRLPRLIGVKAALPFLLEGKPVSAEEALRTGILHELVAPSELLTTAKQALLSNKAPSRAPWDGPEFSLPGGDLDSPEAVEAIETAKANIERTTRGNYPAPMAILSCLQQGLKTTFDEGLRIEQNQFAMLVNDHVSQNMIRTLFFSRKACEKLYRRPAEVPKFAVKTLGIVGSGFMGSGIALVSALAGIEVILLDRSIEISNAALEQIRKTIESEVARKRLGRARAEGMIGRLHVSSDYGHLAKADLVIEAVTEDRSVKAAVIDSIGAHASSGAILASNTSSLPITKLAQLSSRPQNFIGLHFFSPVHKMALVEVIVGAATSKDALARALDYVGQLGKTPIVVNDGPGFYATRCFETYVREGCRMLAEGIEPSLIENTAVDAGMPVGPLALADEVGIDVMHHIVESTRTELGDRYSPDDSDAVIHTMFSAGRLGRKSGGGFYEYPTEGPKRLWNELRSWWPPGATTADDVGTLRHRLLGIQALEAAKCFAEGVVTDPREADVGAILGWSFPSYLGGPLSMIDTFGPAKFRELCERLATRAGERFMPPPILHLLADTGRTFYSQTWYSRFPVPHP